MEEILNEMIEKLEEMNDEKVKLSKIYKEFYTEDIKKRDLTPDMEDFLLGAVEVVTEIEDIKIEHFNPNEIMLYMYDSNLEKIKELENYSLRLYRLYQKEGKNIPYYDELEQAKLLEMKVIQSKEIISVNDFEILFGYSSSAQKGFRTRLNNPIPFIQKEFRSKIMYKRKEVDKWLNKK